MNSEHLKALITCPDSEKTAEYGVAVFAKDKIIIMSQLQERGLVQFHPEGSLVPGATEPDPTWTRTLAGDTLVKVMLNYANSYLAGT